MKPSFIILCLRVCKAYIFIIIERKGNGVKEKKSVRLSVCGTDYFIVSEEDESYVKSIGLEIESKIKEIVKSRPDISAPMAAVLTAMNYCDEMRKLSDKTENMESRLKEYLEIAAKSQVEEQKVRSENYNLRHEINALKNQLKDNKSKNSSHST